MNELHIKKGMDYMDLFLFILKNLFSFVFPLIFIYVMLKESYKGKRTPFYILLVIWFFHLYGMYIR